MPVPCARLLGPLRGVQAAARVRPYARARSPPPTAHLYDAEARDIHLYDALAASSATVSLLAALKVMGAWYMSCVMGRPRSSRQRVRCALTPRLPDQLRRGGRHTNTRVKHGYSTSHAENWTTRCHSGCRASCGVGTDGGTGGERKNARVMRRARYGGICVRTQAHPASPC